MNVAIVKSDTNMESLVSRADFEATLKKSEFVLLSPCTDLFASLTAVIELHGPTNLFKNKAGNVVVRTANHFVETDNLLTALNRLRDPSFLPKSINRPPAPHPVAKPSGG